MRAGPQADALPLHLSLYLDVVRFGAALVVVLGHFGTRRISGGLLFQFGAFGPAAVDVFFVLSGFVVAHAVSRRDATPTAYAVSRLARVYSVVVPALLLTVVADRIGLAVNPDFYGQVPQFAPATDGISYPASLFFLNEVWFWAWQPGSNLPYWSMGFEAWYYVCFGVLAFAPRRWALPAVGVILLLLGPKIAVLFPLWLLGVLCHRLCTRPLPMAAGVILAVVPILVLALWPAWHMRSWQPYAPFGWVERVMADHVYDYFVGLMFAGHVVGVRALGVGLPVVPEPVQRVIRWLAGTTFGIYLFHYPVLHMLAAVLPWPVGTGASQLAIALLGGAVVLVLARLAESSKGLWRTAFAAVLRERRSGDAG